MSQSCTIYGDPVGKPRKRGPYKIVAINKAWFKPKHGMRNSRIYLTWNSMLNRCTNPKVRSYKRYGGRGISVCERWKSFASFYDDMGPQPDGLWLDRLNNDGPYSPENCQWATRMEQANNKSNTRWLTWKGETKSASEWAKEMNLRRDTLLRRIDDCHWSIEKALTTRVKQSCK